jgi:hypothetical protein
VRQRRTYLIVGALGVAALAGGLFAAQTGSGHAQTIRETALNTTLTIDPDVNETFAPPPSDAAPAMSAQQAYTQWEQPTGAASTAIPANATAQLGLLTLPVGPDCGAECHGLIIQNGIAYTALNQLAYGYSYSVCPAGSTLPAIQCIRWIFLDANTGKLIDAALNLGNNHPPDVLPTAPPG